MFGIAVTLRVLRMKLGPSTLILRDYYLIQYIYDDSYQVYHNEPQWHRKSDGERVKDIRSYVHISRSEVNWNRS